MAKPKRPRDPNQLAKMIVDISTGLSPNQDFTLSEAHSRAGIKLGKARSRVLTAKRKRAIARKAAASRWKR